MILYFSSTGNCKYAAEYLAAALNDKAASILDTGSVQLAAGEKLGFVFPTYFWRLPSIVDDFMKRLSINAENSAPYIYFIASYGSTCGQAGTYMRRHLKSKGFDLSASFSIKTVDDWTVSFDLSNKDEVAATLATETPQLETILAGIKSEEKGNKMKGTLPMIMVCGSWIFYDMGRKTKHLHVQGNCIGCGLCERECPLSVIKLEEGKPVWTKDKCTMCFHCLHSCPQFAIQYDDKTQEHGQYKHP